MGRLLYSMIASLDGYVADEQGRFDWAMPDEDVHRFANELQRRVGTHLYGRRMYETMVAWESPGLSEGQPAYIKEFAETWRAADKIVYSRTLNEVASKRTMIERELEPAAILLLKQDSERDLLISGPTLASQVLDLVDEFHLFVAPVLVGGGLPAFARNVRMNLALVSEHAFAGGFVYLQYAHAAGASETAGT